MRIQSPTMMMPRPMQRVRFGTDVPAPQLQVPESEAAFIREAKTTWLQTRQGVHEDGTEFHLSFAYIEKPAEKTGQYGLVLHRRGGDVQTTNRIDAVLDENMNLVALYPGKDRSFPIVGPDRAKVFETLLKFIRAAKALPPEAAAE
jgi:hypothetical protein